MVFKPHQHTLTGSFRGSSGHFLLYQVANGTDLIIESSLDLWKGRGHPIVRQ